jgi:hypothetical protein
MTPQDFIDSQLAHHARVDPIGQDEGRALARQLDAVIVLGEVGHHPTSPRGGCQDTLTKRPSCRSKWRSSTATTIDRRVASLVGGAIGDGGGRGH